MPGLAAVSGDALAVPAQEPVQLAQLLQTTAGPFVLTRETLYRWTGAHYQSVGVDAVRADAYALLGRARLGNGTRLKVTRHSVSDVVDALRSVAFREIDAAPCWISPRAGDPPASRLVNLANGVLDLGEQRLLRHDPRLFFTACAEFPYSPQAPAPARWLRFLQTLWPDDPETIAALQEWFGLLLTDETRYQKALALIGPRRSGKGTILRVLQRVAGDANIVAPTFSTLGLPFGLQPLIGKRVAVLSDARLSARADVAAVAENLLRITGEDCVSIPRKFLSDWHGRLPTRFVLASNELPAFCDASAALSSRFVILRLETSFLGREDHALSDALLVEAPAIFSWALGGLGRLQRRGKLLQPASGRELCQELEASASPIGEFVRDRCAVAPGAAIECGTLFDAWRAWCQSQGRDHPGTASSFARQLHASVPGLRTTQPRVNGARQRFFEGIRLDAGTRWNA